MTSSEIDSSHFKIFAVSKKTSRVTIKKFIENHDLRYKAGCAFYELTKPEHIAENKSMIVEELATKRMITGASVRTILGIPSSSAAAKRFMLDPAVRTEYRIFVESTSYNRVLAPGTHVLYHDASIDALASVKRKVDSDTTAVSSKNVGESTHSKRLKKVSGNPSASDTAVSHVTAVSSTAPAPTTLAVGDYSKIQIVFSYDTTGSMSACIERVKSVVKETISRLIRSVPNIEIAVIAHGDYCDENYYYLLKMRDFSSDQKVLCDFINDVGHTGGGDFEEAYEYVLNKARISLSWKDKANKCLVMIGDATPHGPKDSANKSGLDWKHEAQMLKEKGVKVYAVKCLSWNESKPFYQELANITGGYYLELHQFHAIPDFMVAISYHESDPQQLLQFQQEIRERDGGNLTRNLRQLFSTLTGEPDNDDAAPADLTAVEPGVFQILHVDSNESIRDFVIRQGAKFQRGSGYYEFNKPEEINSDKKIVLMDKATGDMFTGDRARELASIPPHQKGKKVKPPPSDKWIMFIQSKSYNRKLIAGTKFLYEASKEDVTIE